MSNLAPLPSMQGSGALVADFSSVITFLEMTDPEELERILPCPAGFKILVAMPTLKTKTAGGVYLPAAMTSREETASPVALLVDLGPDAYVDPPDAPKKKFVGGPWAKRGDFVVLRSYSGTRFKVRDVEFRLVNDDSVEATVDDPSEIQRL